MCDAPVVRVQPAGNHAAPDNEEQVMQIKTMGWWALLGMAFTVATKADDIEMVADDAVGGLHFPESVACDGGSGALYVSEFVSALKPTEKDGQGRISKFDRDGSMVEERFLPAGDDVLHKPKGVWLDGTRLWVTDIDAVWIFDTQSRQGRKLALPGAEFANDVTVTGDTAYVSDNRLDAVFTITPADFLDDSVTPTVAQVAAGQSVYPNGVYPAADGRLLLAGMAGDGEARGVYALDSAGKVAPVTDALGRLDGLYETADGTLLTTDWGSGALVAWDEDGGRHVLAKDFKGPADFCAWRTDDGLRLVVPDLVKGELRLIRLR
ncbi:MAG: hypothetical protein RKL32_00865 [Gammaproteobacteria bacterium]